MSLRIAVVLCIATLAFPSLATFADVIEADDIRPLSGNAAPSGNASFDLILLDFAGGEINNQSGLFNGDNGNNTLPQGGGADTDLFDESYVTTAGKLKDFYILNFPNGSGGSTVDELVVFLDLNETGPTAQATNNLTTFDVIVNPTTIQGSPDPVGGDVSSAEQAAINQVHTGGTTSANLQSAFNLPVTNQGGGQADYVIFTGIDVFSLNDDDVLLFNVSMDTINNGAEQFFLSGEFQGIKGIPEPHSFAGLMLLTGCLYLKRRRQRS